LEKTYPENNWGSERGGLTLVGKGECLRCLFSAADKLSDFTRELKKNKGIKKSHKIPRPKSSVPASVADKISSAWQEHWEWTSTMEGTRSPRGKKLIKYSGP